MVHKLNMPTNLFLYLFVGIISNLGSAQELQNIMKLDTILALNNLPIKDLDVRSNSFVSSNSSHYLLHPSTRSKKDTFCFTFISKKTKQVNHLKVYAPKVNSGLISSDVFSIGMNDEYIVLGHQERLSFFRILKERKEVVRIDFVKSFDIPAIYKYLKMYNDGRLVCGYIYNSSRKNEQENSLIHYYRFTTDTLYKQNAVFPKFNDVEFSHFSPNDWIAANNSYVAVSQTTSYHITFYDMQGKEKFSIAPIKRNWVQMSVDRMKNIRKHAPPRYPSILIDSLKNLNDFSISRIEGIWFLNEDHFLVCYFQYDSIGKRKVRYFDKYKIRSDSALLEESDLIDGKFPININEIVTKENYRLLTWNYNTYIGNGNILIFKNYAPISYLGRKWVEIKKEEEAYYKENDPVPSLFIYEPQK